MSNELWNWECDLYYRKKQRTRLQRWRRKAYFWRSASAVLLFALFLSLVLIPGFCAEREQVNTNTVSCPVEEPRKEDAPKVEVIPMPEETPVRYEMVAESATVSHYCICKKCCGKSEDHPAYGITASGREAVPYYSVAVDPYLIPLGSEVHLEFEDGERLVCRADDTGSAITGTRIDLCVSDHQEALNLGLRKATVYVVAGDATIDKS